MASTRFSRVDKGYTSSSADEPITSRVFFLPSEAAEVSSFTLLRLEVRQRTEKLQHTCPKAVKKGSNLLGSQIDAVDQHV